MALIASETSCALREVELKNKPAEMISASPKATVPVLVLPSGDVLEESLEIMQWALKSNDPESWLASGTSTSDGMVALIDEADGPFKHHLDRYKYATRYEGADAMKHRTAGSMFLAKLNDQLAKQDYLCGGDRSLADIAIFPFVRQFANSDRAWFDAQPWPNLHAWLERCLGSELFSKAMVKHKPWVSGAPEPEFP
jgi:glutathione S-transferase